jgi:hypothetical protein
MLAIFPKDMADLLTRSPPWNLERMKLLSSRTFFAAGLRMPSHPVLVDVLRKFCVQLHHLTLNAIIQIGKFI